MARALSDKPYPYLIGNLLWIPSNEVMREYYSDLKDHPGMVSELLVMMRWEKKSTIKHLKLAFETHPLVMACEMFKGKDLDGIRAAYDRAIKGLEELGIEPGDDISIKQRLIAATYGADPNHSRDRTFLSRDGNS